MKKVLIVGGTGFLGFHFARHCLKKKLKVIILSRSKPKKLRFLNRVKYIFSDISKKNKLTKRLEKISKISYVINFGGEVIHKKIKKTYSSHFVGLKNLSDYYEKKSLKKFIQIGSGLEYGKATSPHFENFKIKPNSNYALAKAKASQYTLQLSKKKFPGIIIRPYQVYGPYQDANRLIPIVITNCLKNKKFPCSNGKQFRDFLYIDDFVEIVFKIMISKNNNGEIFNVGFGKSYNIKKVINLIQKKINGGYPEFSKIPLRSEENLVTFPNIYKIKKTFKWKPKTNLIQGIKKTIKFYIKEIKKK